MEQKDLIEILTKEVGCKFYTCESSNVSIYGYNETDQSLWVVFKGNKVYKYEGITKNQFKNLHAAKSKGIWVNANLVKPKVKFKAYEVV